MNREMDNKDNDEQSKRPDDVSTERCHFANTILVRWRYSVRRRRCKRLRAIAIFQRIGRGKNSRINLQRSTIFVMLLQSVGRGYLFRNSFRISVLRKRRHSKHIPNVLASVAAQREENFTNHGLSGLRNVSQSLAQKYATRIQLAWRCNRARRELRRRRRNKSKKDEHDAAAVGRERRKFKASWVPTEQARTHITQGGTWHDDELFIEMRKSCFALLGKSLPRPPKPRAIKPPLTVRAEPASKAVVKREIERHITTAPCLIEFPPLMLSARPPTTTVNVSVRLYAPRSDPRAPDSAAEAAGWRARLTELTLPVVRPRLSSEQEKELVQRLFDASLEREREAMRTLTIQYCPKRPPFKALPAPMTNRQEVLLQVAAHVPSVPKQAKTMKPSRRPTPGDPSLPEV